MKIKQTCAYTCIGMVSAILLFSVGAVQAQLGGGTSPGGSMGSGSGSTGESKGSMKNQNRTHGRESSGPMGEGRREMTKPGQSGQVPLGRTPESSGGIPGGSGSMGAPGSTGSGGTGSMGGTGSGGGMGSSGGAGR